MRAGGTPLEECPLDARILLKREDQNPTGSHKDRAAEHQTLRAASRGIETVTISSSGNAAIATSRYAQQAGVRAVVFVHPDTDPQKLAAIDGESTIIVKTTRAINGAKLLAKTLQIPNLRPSTDDEALVGYESLGGELAQDLPDDVSSVVLFVTSGATALSVARVLHEERPSIEVHIVQAEGSSGIVAPEQQIDDVSAHGAAAGRLGVRRSRRARPLRKAVELTGGAGHVVGAESVATARTRLIRTGVFVSDESAANFAVALELANTKPGRVCCIISGAPVSVSGFTPPLINAVDEFDALERVQEQLG